MQEAGRDARLLASFIKDFLDHEGISQTELANRIGISQPSVSRLLRRSTNRRSGKAHARLLAFMQQGGSGQGAERFQQVFRRVWDGTPEHAEALARIVAACQGLTPVRSGTTDV